MFYDKLAELKKIPRGENAADIGTRHCTAKEIETGLKQMGWCELLGSSKLALKAVGQRSATSNEVSGVSKHEPINEPAKPETCTTTNLDDRKTGWLSCRHRMKRP